MKPIIPQRVNNPDYRAKARTRASEASGEVGRDFLANDRNRLRNRVCAECVIDSSTTAKLCCISRRSRSYTLRMSNGKSRVGRDRYFRVNFGACVKLQCKR